MQKPKILIVGGGIGGLSCATALAETGKFDISIFESDIIGGQASSKKSKLCNTEISWRVFLGFYDNLFNIINTIDSKQSFYPIHINHTCTHDSNKEIIHACEQGPSMDKTYKVIRTILRNASYAQIKRISVLNFLCRERAINEYHDTIALEYYLNNDDLRYIIGPYFGLEPSKTTLSSVYKFIYNYFGKFDHQSQISKYPTSNSLFFPWNNYLSSKNVKIFENKSLQDIKISNNKIQSITIENQIYQADVIVFACSLKPLLQIFNKNHILKNTDVCKRMNILGNGQQFYISVNFYWRKPIIKNENCHIYTYSNGWIPVIIKRFINTDFVENNCNKNIKEVWNIGVADYLLGNYVKKYTSQCTFEEIVYELKMNIMNSEHFKNYFDFEKNTWEDYFYDFEFDDRYYKKLPSTEKFSINKGIEENLLHNKEPELGDNIYFSAYYVKNTTGGASMETSCEIGLTTAESICKKYNIENPRKPIYKTRDYLYAITLPLIWLDCLLYKMKMKPITDFINPLLLMFSYIILILLIVYNFFRVIFSFKKWFQLKKKQNVNKKQKSRKR